MMNTALLKTVKNNAGAQPRAKEKPEAKQLDTALKGVLADTYLKPHKDSFDNIQDSLLIHNSEKYYFQEAQEEKSKKLAGFDVKKAALPLAAGTLAIAGGMFLLSSFLKRSSNNLLKTKSFEQLPDLAINMNIKEEPHFAIYRAVRDPNFKNTAAAIGVFIMSGITIACKNFADGAKEIWVKKQSADIEADLQEKLISVERDAFSARLKTVNDIMKDNIAHFRNIIRESKRTLSADAADFNGGVFRKSSDIFSPFKAAFKGSQEKADSKNTEKERKQSINYLLLAAGITIGAAVLGKYTLANFRKSVQNTQEFAEKYTENTLNAIQAMAERENRNAADIPKITELMKSICAKPVLAEEIGRKYNLSDAEIQKMINAVEESKKTIFADAPAQLGGIPKKVQYYCYIDEPRGHLYNWIINPQNKFTRTIFASFTLASAAGYAFKITMDALKEAAVLKENAKTDLALKKRLAEIEVKNFKAKKETAVMPLRDNFETLARSGGKSQEELKQLADNILREIKNGPPYIFG